MDVRLAALKSIIKIFNKNLLIEDIVKNYESKVFIASELKGLVTGVVKNKLTLDFYIKNISSRSLKDINIEILNILRLAIYELEFLNNPEYAVIDSYVDLSKKYNQKTAPFVNGVLRNFLRDKSKIKFPDINKQPVEHISLKYSHPKWMVENWVKSYGVQDTVRICIFNNLPSKLIMRVNELKTSINKLEKIFKEENIHFNEVLKCSCCIEVHKKGDIKKIPGFNRGLWLVQSVSSSLVANVLDPQEGEKILDICAAPGGKTTHIAGKMKNKGKVFALDINKKRLKKVEENCKRLGVDIVKTIDCDARKYITDKLFDRILIDAPCSNTGVLAKRTEARWNKTQEDINNLSKIQYDILKNSSKLVKQGGIVVYSTCSIEKEENVDVINKFLENNPEFKLDKINNYLPWDETEDHGYIQILQSKHNIDGFFIARLIKT